MKSKGPEGPRRPSPFLYALACLYTRVFFGKKYRLETDSSALEGIEPPVLALCNHESNYDFLIAANAMRPLRFNFMVTTYFFHHALLGRLLRYMGCIPKRQYLADAAAIKNVLRVIGRGGSVCIFPEGQVCYSGQCCSIDDGIGKLAKKLGVTVVLHTVRGNFLTAPKWALGKKCSGRIESRASVLFTPAQLSELSAAEIGGRIRSALYYDEYEWQRSARVPYEPLRDAAGLETVLYRCPACSSDLAMKPQGGSLRCERCGYKVTLDEYGFFTRQGGEPVFDTVSAWYRWEYECASREYPEGFSFSMPCVLNRTVEGKHGHYPCGSGVMTADSDGIRFEGERLGEPFAVAARVERQSNVTHSAALWAVDIEGPDANYTLAPADPRALTKFIILFQTARARFDRRREAGE